ncbi:ATP-dependent helicase, partial [Candidatus Woesearchaeota archaeon]|nr:ATP-dependent helicase [Candidatus Woesearchaeota archaeon]
KRGTHLSLSLERLQRFAPHISRVGLSATVAPLDEIAKFLVGEDRSCEIADVPAQKKMDLQVISPVPDLINTDYTTISNETYNLIDKLIQEHKTTLVFTNTRSGTERVVHHLKDKFPKNYSENIGAHHGSLSKQHRKDLEKNLRDGKLKAVVCSTSLELGIDIGYIDLVILLGSPKSVARALQRIGRSGHKLHDTTKGRIIVMDRDDLVECSVLLKSAIEKKIDRLHIPENALDVLAQQIFGIALEEQINIEDLFKLVKGAYPYRNLTREDFDSIISYLAGDYSSLEDRNIYAKIWYDKTTKMIGKRGKMARVIYMTNIGTIPSESGVLVKVGDVVVGTIDEGFLEKMKQGDIFVLGGNTYEFRNASGMVARVVAAAGRRPTVPSWFSESLPLSFDLANEIGRFRKLLLEHLAKKEPKEETIKFINEFLYLDNNVANAIYQYFREQYEYAEVPTSTNILVEHYDEGEKKFAVFHTLYGRRVNDCLARGVAYAISKIQHRDVEIGIADNGFYIASVHPIQAIRAFELLKSERLEELMKLALEKTEILKRRFRHCANRSLMILQNYKGREKRVGRQQVSSMILMQAVKRISDDFPILKEARREVTEDLMDINSTKLVLKAIEDKKVKIHEITTTVPSPFSFMLVLQGYLDVLRMEDRTEFLKRMHEQVLSSIEMKRGLKPMQKLQRVNYDDFWRDVAEKRKKEMESREGKLKFAIRMLQHVPGFAKDEMVKLVNDEEYEMREDVVSQIRKNQKEIEHEWPSELRNFIFAKLSIKPSKEFSEEEDLMHQQLNEVVRRIKLPSDIVYEIRRLISGERSPFNMSFRKWLKELIAGSVPKAWPDELIKFLIKAEKEIC